jgi:hypothetical protein
MAEEKQFFAFLFESNQADFDKLKQVFEHIGNAGPSNDLSGVAPPPSQPADSPVKDRFFTCRTTLNFAKALHIAFKLCCPHIEIKLVQSGILEELIEIAKKEKAQQESKK